LNGSDQHHAWAVAQFAARDEPLFTCEAVWTEAAYLIAKRGGGPDALWSALRSGAVQLAFSLKTECESVAALMCRYADVPMSLADACLVRMSEQHSDCRVFTTDSDFRIYRRFGRQVIPLVFPG
jgi:predicted nucleic acid-binding protein